MKAIIAGALLLWAVGTLFMATVPLSGDEVIYAQVARSFADSLLGRQSLSNLAVEVVGFGWFLPGISIVLTPVYLLDSTPDLAFVRLYASVIIFLLWVWTLREVDRQAGRPFAVALLVFPSLDVTWHMFAGSVWGDLPSGLVQAIIFARLLRMTRTLWTGGGIAFADWIYLEFLLVLAFYLRGNLILVAFAVHVFLVCLLVLTLRRETLLRQLVYAVIGAFCFVLAMLPWSVTASRVLGGTVISTSTPVLAFALTFGNAADACLGPCPRKEGSNNIWVSAAKFSRAYGAAHGISELEVQRMMARRALRDLTVSRFLQRVKVNAIRYFSDPADFLQKRFLPSSKLGLSEATVAWLAAAGGLLTGLLYWPFLALLTVANFWIVRSRFEDQIASLAIKLLSICVAIQPFFHTSHPRYWVGLAGIMAIGAAFLYVRTRSSMVPAGQGSAFLTYVQVAYAVALAIVVCVLILA
ncbi:hypothetical protein [Mesorhizobium australicum]|nr:hypothetical protein [Mesorhizobium australicum]